MQKSVQWCLFTGSLLLSTAAMAITPHTYHLRFANNSSTVVTVNVQQTKGQDCNEQWGLPDSLQLAPGQQTDYFTFAKSNDFKKCYWKIAAIQFDVKNNQDGSDIGSLLLQTNGAKSFVPPHLAVNSLVSTQCDNCEEGDQSMLAHGEKEARYTFVVYPMEIVVTPPKPHH